MTTMDELGTLGNAGPAVDDSTPPEWDLRAMAEEAAAQTIAVSWRGYRNRQVFDRMKEALWQAEGAVAGEVLRQLCPVEAELLSDTALHPRVRFRLAGDSFPPRVVFKVFVSRKVTSVVYMSGKRMIKPASEAAADAIKVMGRQKFIELMEHDQRQHDQVGMSDEIDVTSLKEYMQLTAVTDNLSARLGGRDNGWRPLQPEEHHGVLFDFVAYCHGAEVTSRLKRHVPELGDDDAGIQTAEDEALIQGRALEARRKLKSDVSPGKMKASERKKRIAHLRHLYGLQSGGGDISDQAEVADTQSWSSLTSAPCPPDIGTTDHSGGSPVLDDVEADHLYRWSLSLPIGDELAVELPDV
eukprot:m.19231 g.19231  ORF g.19231 m.19231 type:complete len:355 (-) comp9897_c0_seq1:703-1767(-)